MVLRNSFVFSSDDHIPLEKYNKNFIQDIYDFISIALPVSFRRFHKQRHRMFWKNILSKPVAKESQNGIYKGKELSGMMKACLQMKPVVCKNYSMKDLYNRCLNLEDFEIDDFGGRINSDEFLAMRMKRKKNKSCKLTATYKNETNLIVADFNLNNGQDFECRSKEYYSQHLYQDLED